MGNTIDLIDTDCQVVHYRYDLPACLRYAYIEKDNHLVEAVRSRLAFEPLDTFYWLENLLDPDFTREQLRLDAEVMGNGHLRMEVHPGLFLHPEVIDLESVWFYIRCRALRQDGVFTLGEIYFIWVMAFLKGDLLPRIRGGKLMIINPALIGKGRPGPGEKKAVATAPEKREKIGRLDVPPRDVVKEGKRLQLWACWLVMYRQMYRRSQFKELQKVPHYPRATTRKGRYYFLGVRYLARLCGVDERTVRKVLKDLEAENLIYTRYHGFKGRGCSIIELPVNLRLVWKWRRQPGRQKPST
ncbi:hypothetical protein ES703_24772 [subsurface metagenome]